MRAFLKYLTLFSIPVIVVVAVVFFLPLNREFAYAEFTKGDCSGHGKWIHDRIFQNDRPIDVAFIGTSATWNAIDDSALTARLSRSAGKEIQVVNLGYCRLGTPLQTLFSEEILEQKHVRHIVLEVRPQPSLGSHPMFGFLASTESLLSPPTPFYQGYAQDLLSGLVVRWEQVRGSLIPKSPYVSDQKIHGFARNPNIADQSELDQIRTRKRDKNFLPEETLQERINYHLHWANLAHISRLCTEKNIGLSFLFINEYGRTINVPRFKSELEAIAPLWIPPDSVMQNPKFYHDYGHLNVDGAKALTPFLEDSLSHLEL